MWHPGSGKDLRHPLLHVPNSMVLVLEAGRAHGFVILFINISCFLYLSSDFILLAFPNVCSWKYSIGWSSNVGSCCPHNIRAMTLWVIVLSVEVVCSIYDLATF